MISLKSIATSFFSRNPATFSDSTQSSHNGSLSDRGHSIKNFNNAKFDRQVRYCDWSQASFIRANIGSKATFSDCNLEKAQFSEAAIYGKFSRANLENSDFMGAHFTPQSNLDPDSCNLDGANFIGVFNLGSAFNSDNAKALEKARSAGAITTPDDLLQKILDPNLSAEHATRLCHLATHVLDTYGVQKSGSSNQKFQISPAAKTLFTQLKEIYQNNRSLDFQTWEAAHLIEKTRIDLADKAIEIKIKNLSTIVEQFHMDY